MSELRWLPSWKTDDEKLHVERGTDGRWHILQDRCEAGWQDAGLWEEYGRRHDHYDWPTRRAAWEAIAEIRPISPRWRRAYTQELGVNGTQLTVMRVPRGWAIIPANIFLPVVGLPTEHFPSRRLAVEVARAWWAARSAA